MIPPGWISLREAHEIEAARTRARSALEECAALVEKIAAPAKPQGETDDRNRRY